MRCLVKKYFFVLWLSLFVALQLNGQDVPTFNTTKLSTDFGYAEDGEGVYSAQFDKMYWIDVIKKGITYSYREDYCKIKKTKNNEILGMPILNKLDATDENGRVLTHYVTEDKKHYNIIYDQGVEICRVLLTSQKANSFANTASEGAISYSAKFAAWLDENKKINILDITTKQITKTNEKATTLISSVRDDYFISVNEEKGKITHSIIEASTKKVIDKFTEKGLFGVSNGICLGNYYYSNFTGKEILLNIRNLSSKTTKTFHINSIKIKILYEKSLIFAYNNSEIENILNIYDLSTGNLLLVVKGIEGKNIFFDKKCEYIYDSSSNMYSLKEMLMRINEK